ncbi:MAG: TenA family transcriptional regulator [Nitrososphaerales archaeon]
MTSLVLQIDEEIEKRSLLKHPFYEMWSKGELTRDHLRGYSLEYFQLVKAVPEMVRNIEEKSGSGLKGKIKENQREESEHIHLWTKFAKTLGISNSDLMGHVGAQGTMLAVDEMTLLTRSSLGAGVAAMYAYERDLPKISTTKIRGLKEFYGMDNADSLEYFREHEVADVRHAAVWRNILEDMSSTESQNLLGAAKSSLDSQNRLLDCVMEKYVS